MTNTNRLLVVAFVAALPYGIGCDHSGQLPAANNAPSPDRLAAGSIVHALGRIEPESRIVDVGAPLGSIISKLVVAEGDPVEAGDVLAILDSHNEMLAAKELAAVRLRDARERQRVEAEISQAEIQGAELEQRHAQEVLLLNVQAQEAQVRLYEAEFDEMKRDVDRAKRLRADNAISSSELDDVMLGLRTADEALRQSRQLLEQSRQDREIKLQKSRVGLQQAAAQKELRRIVAEVDALARALTVAEARFERTLVRAPLAGRVIKILTRPGERVESEPLLKMGSTDSMFVVAEVYESDVRKVRMGQHATIKSRAFSETLAGRVVRIGTLVERNDVLSIDPAADVDARIVEVRIQLDESRVAASYNQHQVDVVIHVDEDNSEQGNSP